MIVLKRSREDIRENMEQAFQANGFTTSDGITREFIDANSEIQEVDYLSIYDLENNVRIDTANDDFLDNYGILLDEPRESQSFAKVDDLQTISLFLADAEGNIVAGNRITTNGQGLPIEKGTLLLDSNGVAIMRTLHTVELIEEEVFVKAIAISSDTSIIQSGDLELAQVDLESNPLVDPNLIGNLFLGCVNNRTIENQVINADEDTYRFVLQEKARSVNLPNEDKIRTVFDNLSVRNFVIKRINPASTSIVVYVETRNVETDTLVLQEVQQQLRNILPEGTDIRVRPFVISRLAMGLRISAAPEVEPLTAREVFREDLITTVNNLDAGTFINFDSLILQLQQENPDIRNVDIDFISINGRKLENNSYRPRDIEKVFAFPQSIAYRV